MVICKNVLTLDLYILDIYNDEFNKIYVSIKSDSIITHCRDDTLSIDSFRIYAELISDGVNDYPYLSHIDNTDMDFYDYPILQAIFDNYENFIKHIIPYILIYAREHNIKYKKYNDVQWNCIPATKDKGTDTKNKLFKCLNKRW